MNPEDGIERFISAQQDTYARALEEIRSGRKQSHWMWFVFPQIRGLGFTDYNVYFGLKDLDEAREYLNDPVLGKRLVEVSQAVLGLNGKTALEIFGKPDQRKLRSCMTLFSRIADADPVFGKVLQKYYGGILDEKTISILGTQN
ncbi:DUF1810 domain-containing protein [Flavobacterium hibernum]|uniref:Calpastatin n=1 Tax=Flavobacterium hibernum TaxID=37752 RepID=A0A0D0F047_9FLAO|nr:DUF1810 domain-containing protein [Flavobacterium hibernum]KIO54663.1 hypothetical protein IW18_01260 [Flavobacterium hibernum]OXA84733.1 hypothetical protein B0A73_19165 [Flavobacterium hibernum]STO18413.1 Uncharacterized conserved protein [Flavobacterium hibernum]